MIKKYNQYISEELNFNLKNLFKKKIKNYPEIDPNDVDPLGEENWDDDDLTPVLRIAKKQGLYEKIKELFCNNGDLKTLEGIEKLIKLECLCCWNNKLINLEGIENLKNLKEIYCENNNLTILKEVKNLSNLKMLRCSHNYLTNFEGIGNLVKLNHLNCRYNNLTSLEGIENLTHLEELICSDNNFSDDYKQYLKEYCKKKKIKLYI